MTRIRADVAVFAAILIPFIAVGLEFRSALVFQAVGILAVVVATLPSLITAEGRKRVMDAPLLVIVGIAAVTTATVVGTSVGLVKGHSLSHIAGQALSMGLLPLAAVGGVAAWREPARRQWKFGLLVALIVGCWIQLGWGAVRIVLMGEPSRLFLPNSVSVVGPALLGLSFALVTLGDSNLRLRRIAWIATGSILLVILGSSLRSLWILTPVTVVSVVVAWRGMRSRQAVAAIMAVALLGLGMAGAVWRMDSWIGRDLPDDLGKSVCSLFPKAGKCLEEGLEYRPESVRRLRFDAPVDLVNADAWRVKVRGHGGSEGAIVVALLFFDGQGREISRIPVPVRSSFENSVGIAVGTVPSGWKEARMRLSHWQGTKGRWQLEDVECSALDSTMMVRFAGKALAVKERVIGLVRVAKTGRADGDSTLGFRWHESLKIVEALSESSWVDRMLGRGLGATVRLDVDGFDNRGNWIHYDEVNYIHNWYLFLLFKLGVVGLLLVLGALGCWVAWTIRAARDAVDPDARAFLAASAIAWLIYSIWSLTSPEILDFRMAPLWGWLLSFSVIGAPREEYGECL